MNVARLAVIAGRAGADDADRIARWLPAEAFAGEDGTWHPRNGNVFAIDPLTPLGSEQPPIRTPDDAARPVSFGLPGDGVIALWAAFTRHNDAWPAPPACD